MEMKEAKSIWSDDSLQSESMKKIRSTSSQGSFPYLQTRQESRVKNAPLCGSTNIVRVAEVI